MAGTHDWRSIRPIADLGDEWTPGMRSAARPFRVLELFDAIRRPARAREISERLGIPQSTSSVLLKGLVALGYLDYDPDSRCYQTSLRLTLLGSWRDGGRLRAGALMTMMEELARKTGLGISISNRSGIYLRYMQTVQRELPGRPSIKLAARRYAVWSTGGIALLADMPDRDIARLLRRTMVEDEPRAREIDPDRVWSLIARARRDGWLCETGLVTAGACVIACVIPESATGYSEPLALTLANGLSELDQPPEAIAALARQAIANLGGRTAGVDAVEGCADGQVQRAGGGTADAAGRGAGLDREARGGKLRDRR